MIISAMACHRQMTDPAKKYNLTPDKNLNIRSGKCVRGYHGIEVLTAGRLYAL